MQTILIVDDSTTIRRMVKGSLQSLAQTRYIEASTGLEAIEQLALHPVNLMILDLNMPDLHGLEVVQFMRSHAAYRAIPIIILTTRGDEQGRSLLLNAGASCYLTKPFDPHTLITHVRELIAV